MLYIYIMYVYNNFNIPICPVHAGDAGEPFAAGTPHCGSQQSGDSGEDPICPMASLWLQCRMGSVPLCWVLWGCDSSEPYDLKMPRRCMNCIPHAMHHLFQQQKDQPDGENNLRLQAGVVKNKHASGMPRTTIAKRRSAKDPIF